MQKMLPVWLDELRKEPPSQPKTVYAAVLVTRTESGAIEQRCIAAEVDDGDDRMRLAMEALALEAKSFLRANEQVIVERFTKRFVLVDR